MGVPVAAPASSPSEPAVRVLPSAELAMARLAALNPNLRGCAIFTVTGEPVVSRGEPLVRESAGRKFWLERCDSPSEGQAGSAESVFKHATIPGGEFFGVRFGRLAMLALADPGTLPSLTLLDMQTILGDLDRKPPAPDHTSPGRAI